MKRRFRHGRAGIGLGFHAERTYGGAVVVPTYVPSYKFNDARNSMYLPLINARRLF